MTPPQDSDVREALAKIALHAKIAADNIVEFSNNKPGGMCGWLDDACTHADIAADLAKKLASALAAPVPPAQEDADIRRVRQQLEQEWCALRAMKLAYKATPSPAPQSAEVLAQAGGAAIRCRKMADEVLAALEHGGHGWDEDQIDEVQSKLLPDVYDLLNLLAVASPSAREPAQPVTALWLVQEAVNLCAAGDIDENTDDGLGWGGFVADAKKLLALKDDPVPTVDYLNGHQHGLEWAARMVKADDPRTGDWLHDDRNDLAEAICKGPEMPDAAQPPSPERGEAVHWRAVLRADEMPLQLNPALHVLGFRSLKAAEARVASEEDFNGWHYTIEPLYLRPTQPKQPEAASVGVADQELPGMWERADFTGGSTEPTQAREVPLVNEHLARIALQQIRDCLERANKEGLLADTIWFDSACTLFDHIDMVLEEIATSHQPPVDLTLTCRHSRRSDCALFGMASHE